MSAQPNPAIETTAHLRWSSLLLGGRLLATAIGFVTQVLLVRHLSTGDFGAFAYGLGVVVSARILVSLGHNRIITRFFTIYRERHDQARLLGVLVMELLLVGGLGLALFLGVLASQEFLADTIVDDQRTVAVLAILILLAPLEALDELAEGVLSAYGRATAIFWRQHVLGPTLRLGVVLALLAANASVTFLALGYVAATFAGVLLYVVVLHRLLSAEQVLGAGRVAPQLPVREVFGYSLPMLTTELVYISLNTLSVVMLGYFHGPTAVARLRAVGPLAELNLLARRQFLRLFLAHAARLYERGDLTGLRAAYVRTTAWLAVLTFPVLALTVPLAEPITVILFGERYADSAPYLALLAAGFYVNAAIGFNAELLQAAARLRRLVIANVSTIVVHGALLIALGAAFGAMGVAAATAIALVVQNAVNQSGVRAVLGTAVPLPLPGVYLRLVVATVALGAIQFIIEPPLLVGLLLAALATIILLRTTRDVLQLGEAFPPLCRLPVVCALVAGSADAGR